MKKHTLLLIALISIVLVSCSTLTPGEKGKLANNAWELEYVTGPRITFAGLFPDDKPEIRFNEELKKVSGTTGCNGYSTTYTTNGKMISFAIPGVTTMRYCGDGEAVFLETMKKIDNYRFTTDGKLELLMNDGVMMRFKSSIKR